MITDNIARLNISLRLPLHLILGQSCEEKVIKKLEECYSKINRRWMLNFWADTEIIKPETIVEFAKKYDERFKHNVSFKPEENVHVNDFVLFQVDDLWKPLKNQMHRFHVGVSSEEGLLEALDKFVEIVNFIITANERRDESERKSKDRYRR